MTLIKLKYLCSSFSTPITQDEIKEVGTYPVFGAGGLVGFKEEYMCEKPYLGIIKDGAGVGRISKYSEKSSLLGTMAYIIPNKLSDINWLMYVIMSLDLGKEISSTTIPHIYFKDYGNKYVLLPSVSEQHRIADFLDTECARIDAVIDQTRASIEEYKKLKQSVITQAVTKGIRPNRPMKNSGIEWIGEIAEDYQCRKLKTFSDVISKGTTPKDIINEINSDYCVRYIKSENIVENELVVLPEFGIQLKVHEGELKRSQLSERDILFVIAGASIGKTAIMKKEMIPANTNQATSFIRIKEKYMPFQRLLWYILQSDITKKYISLFAVQSAQPNLSMADLGDMRIPFPVDLKEINQILSYIDETIVELDRLITLKEQLITELNSYKKNTIFEYVTGKKEVSNEH